MNREGHVRDYGLELVETNLVGIIGPSKMLECYLGSHPNYHLVKMANELEIRVYAYCETNCQILSSLSKV